MRYVIAIKQPVYGSQGAFSAYQFARQVIAQGNDISQIFFFQDGVSNGNKFVYPANDEFNLVKAWQALSQQHKVPLNLCVAASQRRGVVDKLTAFSPEETNLAEGFVIAGLAEFIMATLQADRVVTL